MRRLEEGTEVILPKGLTTCAEYWHTKTGSSDVGGCKAKIHQIDDEGNTLWYGVKLSKDGSDYIENNYGAGKLFWFAEAEDKDYDNVAGWQVI